MAAPAGPTATTLRAISVTDNHVNISGGSINSSIAGGNGMHSSGSGDSTILVSGNKVVIKDGTIAALLPNSTLIFGGLGEGGRTSTSTVTVTGNSVDILGGTVFADVHGGEGSAHGDGAATVSDNHVNVSGGNISGNVYGATALPSVTAL